MSRSEPTLSGITYPQQVAPVYAVRSLSTVAVCIGVLTLHTVLVLLALRTRSDVQNVDYWYHLYVGRRMNWSQAETLTHGFYPLGYPWLLRTAIDLGIDGVRFGQFLSWLGSVLVLASIFSIARRMTGSIVLALLAAALVISNRYFFALAVLEGNDMLAAGLQLVALALVWHITPQSMWTAAKRLSIAAGCALGLAYLARYTALIIVPALLLALVIKRRAQPREALLLALLLSSSFVLSAAVQLVPSLIAFGTPFHNTQAKNVWFGVYGNQDWINNWEKVPPTITLSQVIQLDPARFVAHWWTEFRSAFTSLRLWSLPLHLAWIAGGVLVATTRRLTLGDRVLLLTALLLTIAATALAWVAPRFLLVPLLLQALLIVILVDRLARWLPAMRSYRTAAGTLLALVIGLTEVTSLVAWFKISAVTYPQRVTVLLRLAGMGVASEVGTNDWFLNAADTVEHTQFVQLHQVLPYPSSIDELLALPQTAALRYLVLNYTEKGAGDYSAIQADALENKQRLVPLALGSSETAFCVWPCRFEDSTADQVRFHNGMRLTGHRVRVADGDIGVYLYWLAEQRLTDDYMIALRVLDEQGTIVAQQEHAPQLGTYPTSAWEPEAVVVDFNRLERAVTGPGSYRLALVVYEQQSGQPVVATRPGGPAETTVIVQEFSR